MLILTDATLGFELSSYTINEDAQILELNVILIEGRLERNISAEISTVDLDAQFEKDFDITDSVLTFPAGASSGERQTVVVRITDDHLVEANEQFIVKLASADSAVQFATKSAQITIIDNDSKYAV